MNSQATNTELFRRRRELQRRQQITDTPRLRRGLDDVTTEVLIANRPLVRFYCRRFHDHANTADFEAAGMLGLMTAITSFDPDAGAFGKWAYNSIRREVLDAVRQADHPTLTRDDFERRPAILAARQHLRDDGHTPTPTEIATAADTSTAQVERVTHPPHLQSINTPVGDHGTTIQDTLATTADGPDTLAVTAIDLTSLPTALATLTHRERFVITHRYGLDRGDTWTLHDIAVSLDSGRETIRQVEVRALAKLQHALHHDQPEAA